MEVMRINLMTSKKKNGKKKSLTTNNNKKMNKVIIMSKCLNKRKTNNLTMINRNCIKLCQHRLWNPK